jgi:hypothetical protein
MEPDVLYLILCDGVQTDPNNYHRFNVLGLITAIRSTASPPLPVVRPLFLALAVWVGGQGSGELKLQIIEDRSGRVVFRTRPRLVRFVGDPSAVGGVVFHIRNCSFPAAGLYWVEVLFADSVIARQRLFP